MKKKKAISLETFVFLAVLAFIICYLQSVMGLGPMFSTLMNTAHSLLLEVVFYIMAISVIAAAFSALATDFGVIALLNKLISPIMRPIYGLPGAASLGIVTTFISDNPAILSLAKDKGFRQYFSRNQFPALCNLGTSFGMGLILCTYMIGLGTGNEFISSVGCGLLGAFIGSIFSVRIMIKLTSGFYKKQAAVNTEYSANDELAAPDDSRYVAEGSLFNRIFNCILEGGKTGVQLGLEIIPGVLTVCTIVMILTYGPGTVDGAAAYTGAAYEGVALIPRLGAFLQPVTGVLFGFHDASAIAFPLTALGSSGAAMGLVPGMLANGAGGNEIAVFTAIGMCWSGYLSTHISMMDSLHKRELTGQAIISHTIGGLIAGMAAHFSFLLFSMI